TVLNEFDLLSRSIDANIRLLFENDRSDLSYKDEYTRNQRDISNRFRQRLIQLVKNAENIQRNNSRTTDDLLLDIRRTLLVPFSTRTGIFTKMIRDLAIEQKKEINLIMDGGELEIDRTILEKLNDPLIHILRNAVDHGIESPYQRTDKGKPSMGTIHLIIEPAEDQQVMITITDDGIGI